MLVLLNLVCALVMLGVGLVVQLVHYPLFDAYERDRFTEAHARHSAAITRVVLAPMCGGLAASLALALAPPDGVATGLAVAGAAIAVAIFAVTGLVQVPQHQRLATGFDAGVHRALVRGDRVRTVLWTAHAVVAVAIAAAAASS